MAINLRENGKLICGDERNRIFCSDFFSQLIKIMATYVDLETLDILVEDVENDEERPQPKQSEPKEETDETKPKVENIIVDARCHVYAISYIFETGDNVRTCYIETDKLFTIDQEQVLQYTVGIINKMLTGVLSGDLNLSKMSAAKADEMIALGKRVGDFKLNDTKENESV